jgi:superfamily I DNA/RNA helicase
MSTGELQHWMEFACFADYVRVSKQNGDRVWIILYEGATAGNPGRWLQIDVRVLAPVGKRGKRVLADGREVDAIIWPVSAMRVVQGPDPELIGIDPPVLPNDSGQEPPTTDFDPFEEDLRRMVDAPADGPVAQTESPFRRALREDRLASLDVLRRRLGVPYLPRYSVLRIGEDGVDLEGLLALLHYGIRVFLVTSREISLDGLTDDTDELQAFIDARLLEWAVVSDGALPSGWVVDGDQIALAATGLNGILDRAEATGRINVLQYRIVHAPTKGDVLVRAGAGTGKTETMSERLLFLLATSAVDGGHGSPDGAPVELSLDEVAMVTFTREAAREMRRRIAMTISMRQRLCRRCVLPTFAWMMQLGRASISTIHVFSQRLLRSYGSTIGITPDFTVSSQTLRRRELMLEALTEHAAPLYRRDLADKAVPAVHKWLQHLDAVWTSLEGNGVRLIDVSGGRGDLAEIDWKHVGVSPLDGEYADVTREVIVAAAARFGELCLAEQALPVNQLVPSALASLRALDGKSERRLRVLFIDEFQDTDTLQMTLMLEIRRRFDARLFVVGDQKQGIYRFRGAAGSAFDQMKKRVKDAGLEDFLEFRLTRNFRSSEKLLESMHPFFLAWGSAERRLLDYSAEDRLEFDVTRRKGGAPLSLHGLVDASEYIGTAARLVTEWRAEFPDDSIAVLCRRNSQAQSVCAAIRDAGGDCELWQGGDFYRSPAVRELRVLLEALADPSDDAALLELAETRWMGGLASGIQCPDVDVASWDGELPAMLPWQDRFAAIARSRRFDREDLEPLRRRVRDLAAMTRKMPVVACLVECIRVLAPQRYRSTRHELGSQSRYLRCLDHLVTLMNEHFADSPLTLSGLLSWLKVQIATNRSEDTPMDESDIHGKTVALTVHKAKGLEFDHVIIPHTWTHFGPSTYATTVSTVLDGEKGRRDLLWKWRATTPPVVNAVADDVRWDDDRHETEREETRLLYVAMTRAKKRLEILHLRHRREGTWGHLLDMGER